MSTSGSGATWHTLHDEKKHQTKEAFEEAFGQGYSVPGSVSSEESFRSALESLSTKKKEYRPSRLDAKILPSLDAIAELARAVDQSIIGPQHLAPDDTLEGLVWWISFALIEVSGPVSKILHRLPRYSADAELALGSLLL